ncbi:MAG: flagellar brake domain-containing protein [Nitrospinae bacterium]|nr:flagellar brake domain-containing protein [Nitrospinota bacterium]
MSSVEAQQNAADTASKAGQALESILTVGDILSIEWAGKKYNTHFRGLKKPPNINKGLSTELKRITGSANSTGEFFILVDVPVSEGKGVLPEFNSTVAVRFLYDGIIYGFKTWFLRFHKKVSLIALEYPTSVEKRSLRSIERVKTVMCVDAEVGGKSPKFNGVILDFTPTGAKVGFDKDLGCKAGEIIALSSVLADGTEVKNIKAMVKNSKLNEGKYLFGVVFEVDSSGQADKIKKYYDLCRG